MKADSASWFMKLGSEYHMGREMRKENISGTWTRGVVLCGTEIESGHCPNAVALNIPNSHRHFPEWSVPR
jgi:hypothetical protein